MYALHQLHILPSDFLALDQKDKAFIIAAALEKVKQEKAEMAKIKNKR
nr:MAG TPA: hypothetical protein [Caudoviricetes sp.]DAO70464.1 MAG TPA: hypothetical protein [Caudoviricetes sp.]